MYTVNPHHPTMADEESVELYDAITNSPRSGSASHELEGAAAAEEIETSIEHHEETLQTDDEPERRRWWPWALLALAVVGLAVGLGVGLGTKNSDEAAANKGVETAPTYAPTSAYPTYSPTGDETPAPSPAIQGFDGFDTPDGGIIVEGTDPDQDPYLNVPLTPLEVDRACSFVPSQTLAVSAPATGIEKKLSGGTNAYDGDHAIIVSYSPLGTAGAVWALSGETDSTLGTLHSQSGVLQTPESDQVGWDVSVKGDTFVAGAPGAPNGTDVPLIEGWYWAGRGTAVVMTKAGEEWVEAATLEPSAAADNGDFGSSVSVADCECLIAVGAWHDRDSRGSAFVYEKGADGTWTELQKIAPPGTRRSQSDHLHGNFGYTVAINDEHLAVRAPYDSYFETDDWVDPNRGVVYVYARGENGTFQQKNRLYTPEGKQVRAHLTGMIFLDNFLLVGAPGKNKVYVFEQYEGGYRKSAELTPSGEMGDDNDFGIRLDGNGASVMVGDRGGGASYLFRYEEGVWREKAKFDGSNVALSGNSIVQHTASDFTTAEGRYGGEVNFYDIVC